MSHDLAWNLASELYVSCSPDDLDSDFQRAEEQVREIVDRSGLSSAQRKRLRADVIKAALHGFGQIAKAGDCIFIIIQMYIKEIGLLKNHLDLSDVPDSEAIRVDNQPLQSELVPITAQDSGWGYFLIERVANHHEHNPEASSYIIEIFLYREG